jgi:DNA-binding MarR family transcriptional regulator
MPVARKPQTEAAEALIGIAPLVSRWIDRLLVQHDPPLTASQYLALRAIARERLTAGELARRTGVSGPAISQLLAALDASGMIERVVDPDDRRHQALALSSDGASVYRSAQAQLRRSVADLLSGIPRPEADALVRLLPQVEAALAGTPPPRRPPHPKPKPPPKPPPRQASGSPKLGRP